MAVRPAARSRRARPSSASSTGTPTDRGRTLVGAEHAFSVSLPVGDREVVLRGSMDRVEVDRDGLGARRRPQDRQDAAQRRRRSREHPQLGVYQLAVARAPSPTWRAGRRPAGAPSWSSCGNGSKDGRPKVQGQPPLAVHEDGDTDVDRHLLGPPCGR